MTTPSIQYNTIQYNTIEDFGFGQANVFARLQADLEHDVALWGMKVMMHLWMSGCCFSSVRCNLCLCLVIPLFSLLSVIILLRDWLTRNRTEWLPSLAEWHSPLYKKGRDASSRLTISGPQRSVAPQKRVVSSHTHTHTHTDFIKFGVRFLLKYTLSQKSSWPVWFPWEQ